MSKDTGRKLNIRNSHMTGSHKVIIFACTPFWDLMLLQVHNIVKESVQHLV